MNKNISFRSSYVISLLIIFIWNEKTKRETRTKTSYIHLYDKLNNSGLDRKTFNFIEIKSHWCHPRILKTNFLLLSSAMTWLLIDFGLFNKMIFSASSTGNDIIFARQKLHHIRANSQKVISYLSNDIHALPKNLI